jgi:hypothetical protein
MNLRAKQITLASVVATVVAVVLFALFWQGKDKAAVRRYKEQLRATGAKLTVEELTPRHTIPASNSAASFRRLVQTTKLGWGSSLLDTNAPQAMCLVAPGKAMIGWQESTIRYRSTNSWEEVETALAQRIPPLEWMEQIIAHPIIDSELDYRQGFNILLPHLSPLKQSSRLLCLGAICDLRRMDADSATMKIRAILATAQGLENEPLIISQLVRIAIEQIGLSATWELLQSPKVTEAQLATLQADWTRMNFLPGCESAITMERALGQAALAQMRNSSGEFRRMTTMMSMNSAGGSSGDWLQDAGAFVAAKAREAAWQYAWSYPDELRSLKGFEVLLDSVHAAGRNVPYFQILNEEQKRLAQLGIKTPKNDDIEFFANANIRNLMSSGVLSLQNVMKRVEAADIMREIAVTAIALKRHSLRTGELPAGLGDLTPDFLSSVPHDPVDRKPLRYRLEGQGKFVLYSVGTDGVDDGGDPTIPEGHDKKHINWQGGRDWVWPQPATREEIERFYKENAR